jgi:hypothetical protein
MLRRFMKKRVALALSVVAVLAITGSAIAYFSGSGSGNGSASVGSSAGFAVTVSSDSSGALLPGYGSETLTYSVKNKSNGYQNLSATSVAVAHDAAGNIVHNGTSVSGCMASWFTATDTPPAYGNLAGGASVSGSVSVTMQDSGTNQDPCQGATPDITVSAS